ncbi:Sulfotransferase family protein [Tistlia consotensis]|uniref:Sulfotransferase family protein n=1 Tax=Tistlia consotensis USBA 355 TaxID=560819 RepID=A0A1Y6C2C4_9PROT|nr:sulfotransferase [Tistlia consotensis]SMF41785.1 Sulfotransferase family protein [Tistlia consotensis USBA 355]SNR73422.1 Sulfotransferase family protein [Tistlia consotensis]
MTDAPDGRPDDIAPVLILSTGRCGSTLVSEMLNRHPGVLSLSEFFITLGPGAFSEPAPDGEDMWRLLSRQSPAFHSLLKGGDIVEENLYPFDAPGARFGPGDIPPVMTVALPHLTPDHEALFDELEPFVRAQPRRPLAEQYRVLFAHLAERFGKRVWVERSGGSLMLAAKLMRLFPDARIVHVYRDGRDTALSMVRHHNFRVLLAMILLFRRYGVEARKVYLSPKGSRFNSWLQQVVFRLVDTEKLIAGGPGLDDFGRFWSDLVLVGQEAFGDLPPDRLLNLKFEDLQSSPRGNLQQLIRFIDPSLEDPAWLEQVAALPRPARSKYQALPPEQRDSLTQACKPGLELLGYPL